ncbi:ELO family [Entophlyctis helioformis]|nr:ELO family [Entophlyctis helioformis]
MAKPAGASAFSLSLNTSLWDWRQLLDYSDFKWSVGRTPLADLQVILTTWAIYFSTIIGLKIYMRDRPAFKMASVTAYHNMFLCLISLAMCVAGVVGTYHRATTRGIDEIFCTSDSESMRGLLQYTMYMYYLSKFVELFDTVILVLKKKPVIFLHWYHHAIVMLMVWSWLQYDVAFATQGMIANTLIHVFMYYYYYASSLGRNVWYKKYITTGQIVQFTLSFVLSMPYIYYHSKKGCSGWNAFVFSMAINGSFLALFIDFYRRTYRAGAAASKDKRSKTAKSD